MDINILKQYLTEHIKDMYSIQHSESSNTMYLYTLNSQVHISIDDIETIGFTNKNLEITTNNKTKIELSKFEPFITVYLNEK